MQPTTVWTIVLSLTSNEETTCNLPFANTKELLISGLLLCIRLNELSGLIQLFSQKFLVFFSHRPTAKQNFFKKAMRVSN